MALQKKVSIFYRSSISQMQRCFARFLLLFFVFSSMNAATSTKHESTSINGVDTNNQRTLRVATMNAEWLWTPYDGKVDGSRFNQGDMKPSDYKRELRFYRSLIREHRIDVLAVSEIENEQVAREFSSLLSSESGIRWSYAFRQGRDTATGQDVALFSRVGAFQRISDFGFPAGELSGYKSKRLSKVLGGVLDLDGVEIGFITSHFLSKRNDSAKKSAKRLMQAKALLKGYEQYKDNAYVVLLGDFNDYRASPVLRTLEKQSRAANALEYCAVKKLEGNPRYFIDHILFTGSGMVCRSVETVDLEPFSDHPMLIAELIF